MAVSENKVHSDKQGQRIQIKDNRGGKTVQRKSGKGIIFDAAEMIEREAEKGEGRL